VRDGASARGDASARDDAAVRPGQRRVLVVEDDPVTRRVLGAALRARGWTVDAAATVAEALAVARATPPTGAVLDLRLPDGHGVELGGALRSLPGLADLPLVAMSGVTGTLDDAVRNIDLFATCFLKPIDPTSLAESLETLVTPGAVANPDGPVVVLAEDEPLMRRLLALRLERAGYRVHACADGHEALTAVVEHEPDIVVADLHMRRMGGLALSAALRRRRPGLPLVLVSSGVTPAEDPGVPVVPKTADSAPLLLAIEEALRGEGAAAINAAADARLREVEHQARLLAELREVVTMQTAQLSVLAGIADGLQRATGLDDMLTATLERARDVSFVELGAAWTVGAAGFDRVATVGFPEAALGMVDAMAASQVALLARTVRGGEIRMLPSRRVPEDASQAILDGFGLRSAMLIPVSDAAGGAALLLLGSCTDALSRRGWAFGQTIQGQLTQAVRLLQTVESLRATAAAFQGVADNLDAGIVTTDATGRVLYSNRVAEALLGPSLRGAPLHLPLPGARDGEDVWEDTARHSGGRRVLVTRTELDGAGELGSSVHVVRDVTEARRHEEWLTTLVHTDPLTGVANRRALELRVKAATERTGRRRGEGAATVLYLDLDGFKQVNDEHGHDAGDQVLQAVATALRTIVRTTDLVARVGGDEFVLLQLGRDAGGMALGETVRALVQDIASGFPGAIRASVGVAVGDLDALGDGTLLRRADQAMYLAKRAGGNAVREVRGAEHV